MHEVGDLANLQDFNNVSMSCNSKVEKLFNQNNDKRYIENYYKPSFYKGNGHKECSDNAQIFTYID